MENIEMKFEALRVKMIALAMKQSLNSPDVLRLSQELDKLHNEILLNQAGKYQAMGLAVVNLMLF